jgi:LysM repeat protein
MPVDKPFFLSILYIYETQALLVVSLIHFSVRKRMENAMMKRILQLLVVAAILIATFGLGGTASAWSGCSSYVTVQWGDTLSGIAQQCGTTVAAIQASNPGLGWWVYAGQVLYIPSGSTSNPSYPPSSGTYVVQPGDTLGKIAARFGVSWQAILAVNPQIQNPSLIYAGQVIYLPAGAGSPPNNPPSQPCGYNCPPPPPGDGLSTLKIDYKHGMYIRSDPNGKVLGSALYKQTVYYFPNSIIRSGGCVWVKVKVFPPTQGFFEGWLLVKDQLGTFFTSPQIG